MIKIENFEITDEMILNEDNITEIFKMRNHIKQEIAAFKMRTSKYKYLTPSQKKVESSLIALLKLSKSKAREYELKLKEEVKWKSGRQYRTERHLASAFMEIAKDILEKDKYKEILNLAQSRINKE